MLDKRRGCVDAESEEMTAAQVSSADDSRPRISKGRSRGAEEDGVVACDGDVVPLLHVECKARCGDDVRTLRIE
ncbi:BZ3500_MvSof-1268-A1-R1_Chr4-4g07437 [Microbotryum saponariae]|uniref:BZ3500_MvSof-1268-A1-R1_Chr4-4g07437 protein n=1 Tax=Microbotryum saponariae TaxID=289078 RepID=A0A2X0LC85_9BASI|nr:BZ3500_MvSof-1268-A1-R1_Chr4-4g07437 [Microbotryum saponariae]SDA07098.1 BZ3501_MvSof-1269-A2-R1_Chr4-3g07145 [Microbotryum saponariae]